MAGLLYVASEQIRRGLTSEFRSVPTVVPS
jgi:hypothetical protein